MADTRAAERRLRRAVQRLSGCLDTLPPSEHRALVLRAGLGPRPARSRKAVARILDSSASAVRRLERRGLRRLRSLGRAGRCTPRLAREPSGVGAAAPPVPNIFWSAGPLFSGRAPAQLVKGSASVGAADAIDASGSESVIDRAVSTVPKVGRVAVSEGRSFAKDHPVVFILAMFAMLASALLPAVLLVRGLRRSP